MKTKFAFYVLLVISILSPWTVFAEPRHLTILHFNDLHGHLEPDGPRGGAARIATVIRNIEKENSAKGYPTILLFGGDAFSGTLISSEFKGEVEFRALKQLGVKAMVLGNHDFDYSLPLLEKRIGESKLDVVAANVRWKKTKELLEPPTISIIPATGSSIVIVGLVSKETPHLTNSANVADLIFDDPIKTAKKYSWLSAYHILIALTHEGVDADKRLVEKVKGFDVIIGGHDHVRPHDHCMTVKHIPVCQTPANGRYLGRLDFEIDGKDIHLIKSELIPITNQIPEDPKTLSLVREYSKSLDAKYGRIIGRALSDLSNARGRESPLGDLVADAMRSAATSDISFINSGGIRAPIRKGPITLKSITEVLPFDNHLVTFEVSGKKIREIFNFSAAREGGAFLQVSGLSFSVRGKKAKDIVINDLPLDPKKKYTATTVDFLMNGGDGYTMLKAIPVTSRGALLRDIVVDYIQAKKDISPPYLGRIGQ